MEQTISQNQRDHQRFFHLAEINVCRISTGEDMQLQMENLSGGGVLLRCINERLPAVGEILEMKTNELADAVWRRAEVVRIIEGKGFAVKFLETFS